ncbi:MAG: hypothetical protein AAF716_01740 [Cyanobacteria bacterium P01_D01_bin.1]
MTRTTLKTTVSPPTIHLAGDLGASASKFFYRVQSGQTVPIWMDSAVADGLSDAALPSIGMKGRPQDSTWLDLESEIVLVGESAKAFLNTTSLSANKSDKAAFKIAAALGVISELENLPAQYQAVIWIPLPLTEIRTHEQIARKFNDICDRSFLCRGRQQQVQPTLKFFPEGFGLYLNRKRQLESLGKTIHHRRTLILMMGHRNLSVLCFESGSLRAGRSNSDGPGFWPAFEKATRSAGVPPADYTPLMLALTTGRSQQISQAQAGIFDFGAYASFVRQTYWQAVSIYLQDNLLGQLTDSSVDIILSGGGSRILWTELTEYFSSLGLDDRLIYADRMQPQLTDAVSQLPEAVQDSSIPLRMSDCYGLFQGLIGKLTKVAAR